MARKKTYKTIKETEISNVNVTPIVDISFCLVMFCLMALNIILTSGIKILESQSGASVGKRSLKENINVELTKDRKIFIDEKEVSWAEYSKLLTQLLPNTKDRMVIIKADNSNLCEDIVELLDSSKQSGAMKLALLRTEEK